MKLKFTKKLPTKEGFYWWTNFGEHTPTIVEVRRDDKGLWADNEEFTFRVKKVNLKKVITECKQLELDPIDGHYHGEEMWCRIPNPMLDGKIVEPSYY